MGYPSRASEFPNDNVAISSGARWLSDDPVGAVTACLPTPELSSAVVHQPVPSAPFVLCLDDDEPVSEGPLEVRLAAEGPVVLVHVAQPEPEPESEGATPAFRHFEAALTRALMARGGSRAAALVPKLLRLQPFPAESMSAELRGSLESRGYLDENARYSERFRTLCGAWSAVLRGASEDLGPCGSTTLDSFGAQLLAALLTVPATRADELRRELRKAGIAAFGVLEAA